MPKYDIVPFLCISLHKLNKANNIMHACDARQANRPPTRDDDDGITRRLQQHGCHVQFHTAQMMGKSSYDMPARAISRLVCVCLGVCVCVGFGLVLTRQKITTVMDQSRKKYSSSYYDYERRRLLDVSEVGSSHVFSTYYSSFHISATHCSLLIPYPTKL